MSKLTHFNTQGEAHMVDVGEKDETRRVGVAEGRIHANSETIRLIREGGHRKGDVLGVARIAGIMAAKKTPDLVPLCHPLALTKVGIDFEVESSSVHCQATVETRGKTGVEMEAICAVQVALLTIYDMCKAVDRGMTISDVRLKKKSGGRSGIWERSD